MTTPSHGSISDQRERRRQASPPPGERGLVGAALAIGILLMAVQLWILTVALEQFQRHDYRQIYALAGISALIFLGGVAMLWALRRTPSVRGTSIPGARSERDRSEV